MAADIEQLFARLRGGSPFGFMTGPSSVAYETQSPGFFPAGFLDEFDGFSNDFVLYGVYNGAFASVPQGGLDSTIDNESNPLPKWEGPTLPSGGDATAIIAATTGTPSGNVLRFTLPAGTAGESIEMKQYVPIGGSRSVRVPTVIRASIRSITSSANVSVSVSGNYLDATRTFAGGSNAVGFLGNAASQSIEVLVPATSNAPTNATILEVTIFATREATDASTYTVEISDIRVDRGIPWLIVPNSPDASSTMGLISTVSNELRLSTILNLGGVLPSAPLTEYLGVSLGGVKVVGLPLFIGSDIRLYRASAKYLAIDDGADGPLNNVNLASLAFTMFSADGGASNEIKLYRLGTDADYRLVINDTSIQIGPGSSAIDTRIRRSGTKTLTIDDNAGGAATLALIGNLSISEAGNIVLGTTTGTKIGTATSQKIGFFNATPVVQRSAYTQTYSTADKTHANPTAVAVTDNTGGTANTTLESISNPPTQAQVRNNFADLAAQHNALVADLADLKQLVNSLIDDLQALGLVG